MPMKLLKVEHVFPCRSRELKPKSQGGRSEYVRPPAKEADKTMRVKAMRVMHQESQWIKSSTQRVAWTRRVPQ